MKNSLISIITPTYNHELYIAECIESVIAQSYSKWELIVIDDGSTDRTAEIVGYYQKKDNRIKLIKQENHGIFRLAETYNKALSISKGEYIAILEGDDLWYSNKLKDQIFTFDKNQHIILCYGQAISMSSDKRIIYSVSPSLNSKDHIYCNNSPVGSIMQVLLFRNCIPALSMLIKKDALIKINGFHQSHGLPLVDLPTLYKLAFEGEFHFIPKPLGMWRNYNNQITKTYPEKISEGYYKLSLDFYKSNLINSNIKRTEIVTYFNKLLIVSYSRSGRYSLIRKDFKSARRKYLKSIFGFGFYEPVWKLRSIIGLIFSFFHLNIEWLASLLGKKSYKIS